MKRSILIEKIAKNAFNNELQKISSLSSKTLNKLVNLNTIKKRLIRRGLKDDSIHVGGDNIAAIHESFKDLFQKDLINKILQPKGGITRSLKELIKKEGFVSNSKEIKSLLNKLSKKDYEVVNKIGLSHENIELGTKLKKVKGMSTSFRGTGFQHMSPSVIIEESNIVARSGNKNAKNVFKTLRSRPGGEVESINYYYPKFKYGKRTTSKERKSMAKKIISSMIKDI